METKVDFEQALEAGLVRLKLMYPELALPLVSVRTGVITLPYANSRDRKGAFSTQKRAATVRSVF